MHQQQPSLTLNVKSQSEHVGFRSSRKCSCRPRSPGKTIAAHTSWKKKIINSPHWLPSLLLNNAITLPPSWWATANNIKVTSQCSDTSLTSWLPMVLSSDWCLPGLGRCAAYAPPAPRGPRLACPSMIYSLINPTVPSVKLIRAAPWLRGGVGGGGGGGREDGDWRRRRMVRWRIRRAQRKRRRMKRRKKTVRRGGGIEKKETIVFVVTITTFW